MAKSAEEEDWERRIRWRGIVVVWVAVDVEEPVLDGLSRRQFRE